MQLLFSQARRSVILATTATTTTTTRAAAVAVAVSSETPPVRGLATGAVAAVHHDARHEQPQHEQELDNVALLSSPSHRQLTMITMSPKQNHAGQRQYHDPPQHHHHQPPTSAAALEAPSSLRYAQRREDYDDYCLQYAHITSQGRCDMLAADLETEESRLLRYDPVIPSFPNLWENTK